MRVCEIGCSLGRTTLASCCHGNDCLLHPVVGRRLCQGRTRVQGNEPTDGAEENLGFKKRCQISLHHLELKLILVSEKLYYQLHSLNIHKGTYSSCCVIVRCVTNEILKFLFTTDLVD